MKLSGKHTLKEIAAFLECKFIGNGDQLIIGINEIHKVEKGDLVFVDHPKYYQKALNSDATIILIDQEVDCPEDKSLIISNTPFDDYNKLTKHFSPYIPQSSMIGESCEIHPTATIYPNVFIGHRVKIGSNVTLHAGVNIQDDVTIEENVIVGPNSVIGHYAFYYKKKATGYDRMHSCGGVLIKKNAEIGALCTIDIGVSGLTIIGEGTKLDNQVHIGHDTEIGDNCLFAANVGIAGCVIVEDNVTMWGQVGCKSDVRIGEGAVILGQSGVSKDLPGGKTYFGSPCGEAKSMFREMAAVRKLPSILEQL